MVKHLLVCAPGFAYFFMAWLLYREERAKHKAFRERWGYRPVIGEVRFDEDGRLYSSGPGEYGFALLYVMAGLVWFSFILDLFLKKP